MTSPILRYNMTLQRAATVFIAFASIVVTRGPDRLTQQTTSDSSGNYSTRFEQGTGDYLVYVTAPGFKSARRRVQRQLAVPMEDRKNSQWQFGNPVTFADKPPEPAPSR